MKLIVLLNGVNHDVWLSLFFSLPTLASDLRYYVMMDLHCVPYDKVYGFLSHLRDWEMGTVAGLMHLNGLNTARS